MTNVVRKFVNKGICALTVEYILRFAIEEGRVLVYAPEVNFHGRLTEQRSYYSLVLVKIGPAGISIFIRKRVNYKKKR